MKNNFKKIKYLNIDKFINHFPLIKNIITTAIMDDLPLLLSSKDLFLSLSSQKIKTLKQAQEHFKNTDNAKLQQAVNTFETIRNNVFQTMSRINRYVDFKSLKVNFDKENPLSYYWINPSIIEIIGYKGHGKTALALTLAYEWLKYNQNLHLKIVNCAGGITGIRLNKFREYKYDYCDIFTLEDLQVLLNNLKKSNKAGLLVIDGSYSLIISSISQRSNIGEKLSDLRSQGWSVIFTNLIQGKLELEQKEALNAMAYFPNIFGGICDCRLSITPSQNKQNYFMIRTLKNLDSRQYQYESMMNQQGLSNLMLLKLI